MYMDDITPFDKKTKTKKKQEQTNLIETIKIYQQDIKMEFCIEKCGMSGKRQRKERIAMSNQERIHTLGEKENYQQSGILEIDTIKEAEKNTRKETNETTSRKQALQQKSYERDRVRVVFLVRYSGPLLKWTMEELRLINQRSSN